MVTADERAARMPRGCKEQCEAFDGLPADVCTRLSRAPVVRGLDEASAQALAVVARRRIGERVPDRIVAGPEHTLATGSDEPASASARRWC
jgi:hypothetical protein